MSPGWHALGYPTTSVERASGQHAKDLLVIIEEASGVEDEIWNALYSLKYSKLVAIGNPIRAEGRFVDLIRQADKDREDCIPPNKAVCAIHIPSTESPHAHLEKSPYGLADHTWLEACYRHYGSKSLWVGSHIDARIPELSADVLMSKAPFQARVGRAWNDRAGLPGFLRENGGLNPVRRTELGGREIRQEGGLGCADGPLRGLAPEPGRSVGVLCGEHLGGGDQLFPGRETVRCQGDNSVSVGRQFGVSSSLLLPLHQVGKLDSWEDFQDRQAMTLFTTRSTAGTTEPMSSAPTANGICSLAILPAPRHGTLSRSSATA